MTGCMCMIGMAALFGGADSAFFHNCVTFGPLTLPAITFAGGAAAAHFARKRRYVPQGEGRNITRALLNLQKPDVILFGGIVGTLGYALNVLMTKLGLGAAMDTSATAIVIIALGLKLLFDGELLGRANIPGGIGRYHPDAPCWQATMTRPFDKVLYGGLIAGMAACCVSQVMASDNAAFAKYGVFLPFGFSSIVLLLNLGGTNAPTTHHITLCAAYTMANGGGSIGWGIIGGIVAVFMADLLGRTFHMYGDCYVDPAALAICVTTPLVQWLLPMTGIYQFLPEFIPWVIIAAAAVVSYLLQRKQARSTPSNREVSV